MSLFPHLLTSALSGPLEVEATPSQVVGVGHDLTLVCQLSSTADPAYNNIPEEDFVYSWTHNGYIHVYMYVWIHYTS